MNRWQIASRESEEQIVGGVLVHPKNVDECLGVVMADDFSDPLLGKTWEAIATLDSAGIPIDAVTVFNHMKTAGTASSLRAGGGVDFLIELMSVVVTVENIGYHASTVAKLAQRRRWASTLREMATRAGDQGTDADEFFADVEGKFLQLMTTRRSESTMLGSKVAMRQLCDEFERRFMEKDAPVQRGVTSGIWALDHVTGGWKPGQLIVLAARPRVGKSALAGNIIEHCARRKVPALMFSLEMEALEVYERMIAANGVKSDALRTGHLSPDAFIALTKAAGELAEPERMWIDSAAGLSIVEIRSRARRWRARQGIGDLALIAVDFLQLVKTARRGDVDEQERLHEVSYGLKELAKELKCPVLALAQLNKEVDKRTDQRPKLADIRGGAIEAAADHVYFLYREEIADPECSKEKKGTADLIIGKGRGIPPDCSYKLRFDGATTKFSNPKA